MSGPRADPASRERLLLASVFVLGALIRVPIYLGRASLWIDEARVALNIGTRSYAELLRPLDYDQAAPPLFLWATKLAVAIGGMGELSLRAIPLVAGLLVPPLAFLIGRQLGGITIGAIAGVLTAVSPGLVRHVAELKPYELDAFLALLLVALYLAGRPFDRSRLGWGIAIVGAVALWASTTAVFVVASLALVAVAAPPSERAAARSTAVPAIALWAASFAAAYGLAYRPAAANPYLREFWRESLVTIGTPHWLAATWSAVRGILGEGFVTGVLELPPGPVTPVAVNVGAAVLGALVLIGLVALGRKRGWSAALLWLPWAAALGASLLGLYPLSPRLTLFGLPLLTVAVAAGLVALRDTRPPLRIGLTSAFGVMFATGAVWCVDRIAAPARDEHVRPAVDFFKQNRRPGESVYVLAGALPAWGFYTTDWRHPDRTRLARIAREASSGGLAFENASPRTRPVDGDGAHLVFPYDGWIEILGVHAGVQWRSGGHLTQTHPDTNWTASEARRIRAAANPSVWVLTVPALGLDQQLRAAVESGGGRPGERFSARGADLIRYRFEMLSGAMR